MSVTEQCWLWWVWAPAVSAPPVAARKNAANNASCVVCLPLLPITHGPWAMALALYPLIDGRRGRHGPPRPALIGIRPRPPIRGLPEQPWTGNCSCSPHLAAVADASSCSLCGETPHVVYSAPAISKILSSLPSQNPQFSCLPAPTTASAALSGSYYGTVVISPSVACPSNRNHVL